MKNFKNWLVALVLISTTAMFGQATLTGKVVDDSNQPLPGASIVVKGTTNGVSTDFDGNFTLSSKATSGSVLVSFVGYTSRTVKFNGTQKIGSVMLSPSAESLDEIVIVGVADIAKDRKTPVAATTIKGSEILEKLGTKEFPEILNTTPSVYATKQGGGFGDSRINIRGFDQANTAVMINGMPVNDMENGWVYWSNWAGLSDVTSAMQVQRGLGSSKLAISSVGGTINILTKSSNKSEGGSVAVTTGNDNYLKTLVSYNTGKMENGLSVSALFGKTSGDGFVEGTEFDAYNFYLAFGYNPNENHDFQFTVTGAPQYHNKRGYAPSINDYIKYGGSNEDPNIKYNSDFGYRDGKEASFGGNFYHKPVASLNWDWNVSDDSKLSTVLYASLGRGGSVGSIGRVAGGKSYYGQFKDNNGHVKFDDIIDYNSGKTSVFGVRDTYTGGGDSSLQGQYINGGDNKSAYVSDSGHIYGSENGISQRSSMNSHNWFGAISNFNTKLNETLTLDFGVDLRTYTGLHYRRLVDYLGADGYVDNDDLNNPYNVITETYSPSVGNIWNVFSNTDKEQKIDYYNEGKVNWAGAFTQLEYSKDDVSAFIQGAVSNQSFKRIDYFNYLDSDPDQESDWESIIGGNVKGGVNWNIDEAHNVFVNAGFYSKQPKFDAVFPNYSNNETNEDLVNEKVIGVELGYGFRSANYRVNLNAYRTSWSDRFYRTSSTFFKDTPEEIRGVADMSGIEQVHMGVELESSAKFGKMGIKLMASVGDYEYKNDVTARYFDESNNPISDEAKTLYLDGKKVGDAPQTTVRWEVNYEIAEGLKFDISQFYVGNLYASIDAPAFTNPEQETLELPGYTLVDAGLSYKLKLKNDKSVNFRLNINNLADTTYITESDTNYFAKEGDSTWKGISTDNRVFFGWGRTWNASVRFNF